MSLLNSYRLVVKPPTMSSHIYNKDFETEEDAKEFFRLTLKPFAYTLVDIRKLDSQGREIPKDQRRFTL